jgi:hypothetical protein
MKKWTIKHEPTVKFYYEDEGGAFLVDLTFACPFKTEKEANEALTTYIYVDENDNVFTEDGEFPITEFKVVALSIKELT